MPRENQCYEDTNVDCGRSRPPYPIASLDLNHIGSYTSHAHDFQSPDNIIMVRSTDKRTIAQKNGTEPPTLKTVTVSTVETYNRNQNTVRKLTTKSVDGVLESKETIVTDITRAPLLGSQVNLRADKLKTPSSNTSTPLRSQTLPRQTSNASLVTRSVPRTPQKRQGQPINKDEFFKQCLDRHNEYRAKHKVDPLQLNSDVSAVAQDWANHLAGELKMYHRPNNKYGENLWMYMTSDKTHKILGSDAVDSWYLDEFKLYTFGTEPKDLAAGHLTQVLWAGSKFVGIGYAQSGEYTFVVCNYNPPGNYKGEYAANVPPLGGSTTKPGTMHVASVTPASQDSFAKDALKIHNDYRAKHGSPPLTLDANITKFAQSWADQLAETNQFKHRTNNPYGENIFWSSGAAGAKVMCDSWYAEEEGYNYSVDPFKSGGDIGENSDEESGSDFASESDSESSVDSDSDDGVDTAASGSNHTAGSRGIDSTGGLKSAHFTQLVWKDSKQLGIGRAFTKNGAMIAVANYSPRGNIIGKFTVNVLPPGKRR